MTLPTATTTNASAHEQDPMTASPSQPPPAAAAPDVAALFVTDTILAPPSLAVLPILAVLVYLHVAAARWLGFEASFADLLMALPSLKPWSTLAYYYGLSFGLYWIKPTVLDFIGREVFSFDRRQRWGLRRQVRRPQPFGCRPDFLR